MATNEVVKKSDKEPQQPHPAREKKDVVENEEKRMLLKMRKKDVVEESDLFCFHGVFCAMCEMRNATVLEQRFTTTM